MKHFIAIFALILVNILFCGDSLGQEREVLEKMKPLGIRSEYFLTPKKNIIISRQLYNRPTNCKKEPFLYNSTSHITYQREEVRRMACF